MIANAVEFLKFSLKKYLEIFCEWKVIKCDQSNYINLNCETKMIEFENIFQTDINYLYINKIIENWKHYKNCSNKRIYSFKTSLYASIKFSFRNLMPQYFCISKIFYLLKKPKIIFAFLYVCNHINSVMNLICFYSYLLLNL